MLSVNNTAVSLNYVNINKLELSNHSNQRFENKYMQNMMGDSFRASESSLSSSVDKRKKLH